MEEKKKIKWQFSILMLIVLLAAFSRLVPHPPNFTPIGAMALFGAAWFTNRFQALLLPLLALWLSDLALNNLVYARYYDGFTWLHSGFYWTYGAFLLIGLVGRFWLKKVKTTRIVTGSLMASTLFFLISNFGVWTTGLMYPITVQGLIACYTAALPFFLNTLVGDLLYSSALFGTFELARNRFPALQINRA